MPRTKKNHIAQNEDPRFHNTYQFLKHYRDATYSLKVVVHQLETQFQIDYGTSIDHFLDSIYAAGADLNGSDSIYAAGADLNGSDIEERAKSIERSNKMLKLLDSAVDLLRSNHKYGEQYYWILYYSFLSPHFLSPQELRNTDEIIDRLAPHIDRLSYRTFYRRRHAAIEALSAILWGFTAKETIHLLEQFFPEEEPSQDGSTLAQRCD